MDVGAINCEKPMNRRICTDWLAVGSYPSILLINRHHGTLARYPKDTDKGATRVASWARDTAKEWRTLFLTSHITHLDATNFDETVISDHERAWVVLFTDGIACAPCRTARTNLLRLSTSLAGLPVGVGYIDCETPTNHLFCRQHGMPDRPHAPDFFGWPRGLKTRGEVLFSAAQIEAHRALELIDRGLRLALSHERDPSRAPEDHRSSTTFDKEAPPPGESGGFGDASGGGPPGGFRWDTQANPNAKPLPWGGPTRPDVTQRIGR